MSIWVMRSSGGRMPYALSAVILVAGLGCPMAVLAAEGDPVASMFSLHGFGTLGEVYSDAHDADFVGSPFQPNGAGYSHTWSPGVDSKAGLQVGAQFTDRLSAIVQVVSQHIYDNTWRPQLEWANLRYQVTPDFSIRAGRSVAAAFLVSDTSLVGYTYPWIRPPPELYGELPVSNQDGLAVNYHLHRPPHAADLQCQLRPDDLENQGRRRGLSPEVPAGQRRDRGRRPHVPDRLYVAAEYDRYSGLGSAVCRIWAVRCRGVEPRICRDRHTSERPGRRLRPARVFRVLVFDGYGRCQLRSGQLAADVGMGQDGERRTSGALDRVVPPGGPSIWQVHALRHVRAGRVGQQRRSRDRHGRLAAALWHRRREP